MRRFVYVVVALLVVVAGLALYMFFGGVSEESSEVPLYEVVEPISFEEFLDVYRRFSFDRDVVLKLPTLLPEGLEPVAVWFMEPFIAVIAYDDGSVENYEVAELAIQVSPLDPGIYEYGQDDLMDKFRAMVADIRLNGREAFVTRVDEFYVIVAYSDLRSYTAYVYDLDGGFRYVIVAKNLSLPEDMLHIVASMEPIEK